MNISHSPEILYERATPLAGKFSVRAFDLEKDLATIHRWVNLPYAQYWGLLDSSPEKVRATYQEILESGTRVFIGESEGKQKFLMEQYDCIRELDGHYEGESGDTGMHILVGPPDEKIPGYTWAVFSTVMDFLFSDPNVKRVVVEPDVRNEKIHVLNKKAGFKYLKQIVLPHKTAWLAVCEREDFLNVQLMIDDVRFG